MDSARSSGTESNKSEHITKCLAADLAPEPLLGFVVGDEMWFIRWYPESKVTVSSRLLSGKESVLHQRASKLSDTGMMWESLCLWSRCVQHSYPHRQSGRGKMTRLHLAPALIRVTIAPHTVFSEMTRIHHRDVTVLLHVPIHT